MKYAEIIIDIAHSNLDKIFEYALPDEMHVSPGSRVAVPFGNMKEVEGYVLSFKETPSFDAAKCKMVQRIIDERPIFTEEQLRLAYAMRKEYHTTLAFALRLMFPAGMRKERIRPRLVSMVCLTDEKKVQEAEAQCFTKEGKLRAKNRYQTLQKLKEGPFPLALLDRPSVLILEKQGIVARYDSDSYRRPYLGMGQAKETKVQLNAEQKAAVQALFQAIAKGEKQTFLLHGVTGSGKTEVYLCAIEETLRQGKTAILLVPEISLTPQIYRAFQSRFGNQIAVFHSGLSEGERFDEWRRVRDGKASIVLGARSAVFLPLSNLGLIVMDEAHAESYRSEQHPYYHAAEVAHMRCHLNGAVLLKASATPLLEDYMKAKLGIYRLLELPQRVQGLMLPKVEIVDMKKEYLRGNRGLISGALHQEIAAVLAKKKQAMLFLNRRGYASSVVCPACGHVRMCTHCDVPLKYHKADGMLACHHCGRQFAFDRVCPACGEPFARFTGIGTEQLQEQVQKQFPHASILRMDFDTTRKKQSYQEIYEAFRDHKADLLIGTQMIARGFDFPDVTLAAIVSADSMLSLGDYRDAERTFSMIEQVAGRAGRREQGNVIVQTFQPDHYAIQFAAAHDYQGFYRKEAAFRKITAKPPFAKLFRFVFSGKDEKKTKQLWQETDAKLQHLRTAFESDIILYTAKQAPIAKLEGNLRYHILIKVKTKIAKEMKQKLYDVWEGLKKQGVTVAFYTDPSDIN